MDEFFFPNVFFFFTFAKEFMYYSTSKIPTLHYKYCPLEVSVT